MSATPKTDAERRKIKRGKYFPTDPVSAEFARQLECELAALRYAAQAHLANPYPHDLMEIRREVTRGYESEEDAAADLDAYCTEEAAMAARQAWREARDNLEKILKTRHDY